MVDNDIIDTLIARAEALVCWMTAEEAAGVLIEGGVTPELAFLAVRAAEVVVVTVDA